jgi:hypothetical protein
MAVDVHLTPQFESGAARLLFATRLFGGGVISNVGHNYAPAADGRSFLLQSQLEDSSGTSPITVVLNWLKRP